MNIDKQGRDFIAKQEGVRLKAYQDQVGIPTIGIGFTYYPATGKKIQMGDIITSAQCDEMFIAILKPYEAAVTKAVKITLNQNKFNALVSFSYNVGTGALASSTLIKKINANAPEADIREEFNKWTRAGGKVLSDLVKRRKDEANLYFTAQ